MGSWTDNIVIPVGYGRIFDGKVRKSDKVFHDIENSFVHPKNIDYECIGSEVKNYYCVIRKL